MLLNTPKYRLFALQLPSSDKLDIKIAMNTQDNYPKAPFVVFTADIVLEMVHVQIRDGMADCRLVLDRRPPDNWSDQASGYA